MNSQGRSTATTLQVNVLVIPESMQLCYSIVCNHQQPRHVSFLCLFQHVLAHASKSLCQQRMPLAHNTILLCQFQQNTTWYGSSLHIIENITVVLPDYYTVFQKKQTTNLMVATRSNLNGLKPNSFTG